MGSYIILFQLHLYVDPLDSGASHNFLHLRIIAHQTVFLGGRRRGELPSSGRVRHGRQRWWQSTAGATGGPDRSPSSAMTTLLNTGPLAHVHRPHLGLDWVLPSAAFIFDYLWLWSWRAGRETLKGSVKAASLDQQGCSLVNRSSKDPWSISFSVLTDVLPERGLWEVLSSKLRADSRALHQLLFPQVDVEQRCLLSRQGESP